MSAKININSEPLERKLAALSIFTQKSLLSSLKDGAKRFTANAVKNTMPMMLKTSPAKTKREWQENVRAYYETHRLNRHGYMNDPILNRVLAKKNRQLGREAAGWNAAAVKLGAKVPAWVRRHGTSEGRFSEVVRNGRAVITVTNSVPYNMEMTRRRAEYALQQVDKNLARNLRALKQKLQREARA